MKVCFGFMLYDMAEEDDVEIFVFSVVVDSEWHSTNIRRAFQVQERQFRLLGRTALLF